MQRFQVGVACDRFRRPISVIDGLIQILERLVAVPGDDRFRRRS